MVISVSTIPAAGLQTHPGVLRFSQRTLKEKNLFSADKVFEQVLMAEKAKG